MYVSICRSKRPKRMIWWHKERVWLLALFGQALMSIRFLVQLANGKEEALFWKPSDGWALQGRKRTRPVRSFGGTYLSFVCGMTDTKMLSSLRPWMALTNGTHSPRDSFPVLWSSRCYPLCHMWLVPWTGYGAWLWLSCLSVMCHSERSLCCHIPKPRSTNY